MNINAITTKFVFRTNELYNLKPYKDYANNYLNKENYTDLPVVLYDFYRINNSLVPYMFLGLNDKGKGIFGKYCSKNTDVNRYKEITKNVYGNIIREWNDRNEQIVKNIVFFLKFDKGIYINCYLRDLLIIDLNSHNFEKMIIK